MILKGKLDNLFPHLMILGACIIWGIMAPLGKHAMTHGVDPYSMFFLRVSLASICLWITDLFRYRNHIARGIEYHQTSRKDIGLLAIAAIFGSVCNQGLFTAGLSQTWPINASILTTTLPIFSLLVGVLFYKSKCTIYKGIGILIGLAGALLLILGNRSDCRLSLFHDTFTGDILIIIAQCSVALYINAFKHLIERNNALTVQKWMMTFATLYVMPFVLPYLADTQWTELSLQVFIEVAFVVLCSTFIANVMMTKSQQHLQPTVVAMYNYVQPAVAWIVSVLIGTGTLEPQQLVAVVLVFIGVRLVTHSK